MNACYEESDEYDRHVAAFREGSEAAFRIIVQTEQESILCYLKCKYRNLDDVEAVRQEALLKMWKSGAQLKDADVRGFRRWMFTIVDSCAIDAVRRAKAIKRTSLDNSAHTAAAAAGTERPFSAALLADLEDCMRELKSASAEFYAAVLRTYFGDSCDMAEHVESLSGITHSDRDGAESVSDSSTQYTQKHRGIAQLKKCMNRKGWGT